MRAEDTQAICSLHEQFSDFPLPNFGGPNYALQKVVELDGQVIAAVAVRKTAEVVLVMDLDTPRAQRVTAIQGLLENGIFEAQQIGIDELHAFLTGEIIHSFERLLCQKFGFVPVEGVPLVLRLGGHHG